MIHQEHAEPHADLKGRAIRLFTFLREVVRLRTKIVRSLDKYEQVIWIDDIPREPECRCIAWVESTEDEVDSVWLEVKKPRLQPPPKLPEQLIPWVNSHEIQDSSKELPDICEQILADEDGEDEFKGVSGSIESTTQEEDERPQFIYLKDRPEIQDVWLQYLTDKWEPWAEVDRRKHRVQRAYTDLFTLYQQQKELGESYEVVLGLGQLHWRVGSGHVVNRHLIVAQTTLEFDSSRGVITVAPSSDGAKPSLEQDMLDPTDRPPPDIQAEIEKNVAGLEDHVWHNESLLASLRSWANSAADGRGNFEDESRPSDQSSNLPSVRLAPAFILRRRTERSLLQLYKQILDDLQSRSVVPKGLRPLVDIHWQDDDARGGDSADDFPIDDSPSGAAVEDLYFPLPSNEEQREIVKRLSQQRGVLVQGPPGTGKSHTIANLVSHLLATGKRILVTSQTPRALRVLKDKIPKEVSDLCVVLLGHDQTSFDQLESSVQNITQRLNTWDRRREQREVERLEKELHEHRAWSAKIDAELRSIREAETRQHPPMNGGYSGSFGSIARRLGGEESEFGWICDLALNGADLPDSPGLTEAEAVELVELNKALPPARLTQVRQRFPDIQEAPSPQRVEDLIAAEARALQALADSVKRLGEETASSPLIAETDVLEKLSSILETVLTKNSEIERHVLPFTEALARDMRSEQDQPWRVLLVQTKASIQTIEQYAEHIADLHVVGHTDVDLATLREDARKLVDHLEAEGKLKRWFRYTSMVRERLYLVEKVKVGGKHATTADTLRNLFAWTDIQFNLKKLRGLWNRKVSPPEGDVSQQLAAYRDFCEPLEAAEELYAGVTHAAELLQLVEGLRHVSWHNVGEIEALKNRVDAELLRRSVNDCRGALDETESMFRRHTSFRDVHEAVRRLAEAVSTRNAEAYGLAHHELARLGRDRRLADRREALLDRLRSVAPRLAEAVAETKTLDVWDTRLRSLQKAWNWLRTDRWRQEQLDPRNFDRLCVERISLTEKINSTIARLAAAKAWIHCMERMTPEQETYLKAWMTAVRRIGAGTGKRAARFRRVARKHLDQCRSAIPAWVMPLYRVVESVSPGEDVFDVAIIDEASQSGIEALFLHYIARKVVVVGDDRQIAPDYIGLPREEVEVLRRRHIADLPLTDHYDLEHSFFDQAFLRFGNRIRLREHFRCMPEIIQFSNNLCYQNEPLIPLRQYGENRLDPVVTKYVKDGYTKGQTPHVVNPAEAEAVVDQIERCCCDPAYTNKTFGVISLLGRDHAREIEKRLLERIGPQEIEKRRLVCGDAYAFQGDERHIMFLSLVVAPDRRTATLTGERFERRFNVAASRAQDQMWLFHSVTSDEVPPRCMRYRLLKYCFHPEIVQEVVDAVDVEELERLAREADRSKDAPRPFDSWFEIDVFLQIHRRGYRVLPQYPVAGYRIDLVVTGMKDRIALECDGERWHGPDQYDADMARQRQLERCGWEFWRIRSGDYYRSPEKSLDSLWKLLGRHGITPGADTSKTDAVDAAPGSSVGVPDIESEAESRSRPEIVARRGIEPPSQIAETHEQSMNYADSAEPDSESSDEGARTGAEPGTSSIVAGGVQSTLFPLEARSIPCPDPRTANMRQVREALVRIICNHGPIVCHYAYRIYAGNAGIGRLSKRMRPVLNRAVASAIRAGTIEQANEYQTRDQMNQILRAAGSPPVVVRPRGDRDFDAIPPSEIAAVMSEITRRENAIGRFSKAVIFRKVLDHYGFRRLTEKVKNIQSVAYKLYVQGLDSSIRDRD